FDCPGNGSETVAVLVCSNGVESRAVVALPHRTVPVISAAGVNNVGNRAAAAAKFRGIGVGLDHNFADSFKILRLNGLTLNSVIVIIETIDQEVVGARPKSVYREA